MRVLVVLLMGVVLFVAGCGGRPGNSTGQSSGSKREVVVKMSEFKFEPTSLAVNTGTIEFKLQNVGTVEHSFVIMGAGKGTAQIRPGVEEELEVSLQPGTYSVVCDTPGHKEAGMTLTLVVK